MRNQLHPEEQLLNNIHFIEPPQRLREQAKVYETQLMELYGITNGQDMIYEDVSIDEKKDFYIHTLRSKNISPEKPNFIFIHGYLGNSTNFMGVAPFILKDYNVYIPDTIGMALSSRPQVKFTSSTQCTDFFIDTIEKWRKALGISKFYICGHSLGGFFVGSYVLKYPKDVLKVLLLSPAGITKSRSCCEIHKQSGYISGCLLRCLSKLRCLEPRVQQLYNCSCLTWLVKIVFRHRFSVPKQISELNAKLTEIAMEYPSDLDRCMWYIFTDPFPQAAQPLEERLLKESTLDFVICFGATDYIDKAGSFRLMNKNKERFVVKIIEGYGHNYEIEKPKEVADVIYQFFGEKKLI